MKDKERGNSEEDVKMDSWPLKPIETFTLKTYLLCVHPKTKLKYGGSLPLRLSVFEYRGIKSLATSILCRRTTIRLRSAVRVTTTDLLVEIQLLQTPTPFRCSRLTSEKTTLVGEGWKDPREDLPPPDLRISGLRVWQTEDPSTSHSPWPTSHPSTSCRKQKTNSVRYVVGVVVYRAEIGTGIGYSHARRNHCKRSRCHTAPEDSRRVSSLRRSCAADVTKVCPSRSRPVSRSRGPTIVKSLETRSSLWETWGGFHETEGQRESQGRCRQPKTKGLTPHWLSEC